MQSRLLFFVLSVQFLFFKAQGQLKYEYKEFILFSKFDSTAIQYRYPEFSHIEKPQYADALNLYIKNNLLPDTSLNNKLVLISKQRFDSLVVNEIQFLQMSVSYVDEFMVCLKTISSLEKKGKDIEILDVIFQTRSIASGNFYDLKNLFLPSIYDSTFASYEAFFGENGMDLEDMKRHVIGFGLIQSEDKNCTSCITLQLILKEMYSDAGPIPFIITLAEIKDCINSNGPLNKYRAN